MSDRDSGDWGCPRAPELHRSSIVWDDRGGFASSTARLEDIAATIHANPTQSEAFQSASMKALGHAIRG